MHAFDYVVLFFSFVYAGAIIRRIWVQFACVAVELAMWGWYFSALQGALKG